MQGQDTEKASNVVSLFTKEKSKAMEAHADAPAKAEGEGEESFENVVAKNMKNKERMEKERANANKSVLRSYRIKH